ncbi:tetraacyldisaccharide 4'-kinase [Pedobacter sp. UYP30]|uniref:tetraacyldisaccharide 4'-kinase n=1 Tax=Pedobacter sp. UYP30 TaxID=1756400 RepID=UPI0033915D26
MQLLNKLRILLLPFSFVYWLIIVIRNKCYDWEILKSERFDFPIICVGNLAVGGSGKTPTTEYLIRLLKGYRIATLSRGYGRKTKGFFVADDHSTAETIGDEPLQYFHKFKHITVAVSEDRVEGVKKLMDSHDLIILDDAFQHRRIRAGLNILLFEFSKLRRNQFMLPAGNLRDVFSSRKRADILMVSKTPKQASDTEKQKDVDILKDNKKAVVHSFLQYGQLIPVYHGENKPLASVSNADVFLLTGIANPQPLISELTEHGARLHLYQYPDHHTFSPKEIEKLATDFIALATEKKLIITTEKDCQRLKTVAFKNLLVNSPAYYIPIEIDLLAADKGIFDETILQYVKSHTRNR